MIRKTPKRKLKSVEDVSASSTTNSKKKSRLSHNNNDNELQNENKEHEQQRTGTSTKKLSTRKRRSSNILVSPLSEGDDTTVIHPAEHMIRPNINADTYENINVIIPLNWNHERKQSTTTTNINSSAIRGNTSKIRKPQITSQFIPKTIETKILRFKISNKEDNVGQAIESEEEDDGNISHPTPIRYISNNRNTRSLVTHNSSSIISTCRIVPTNNDSNTQEHIANMNTLPAIDNNAGNENNRSIETGLSPVISSKHRNYFMIICVILFSLVAGILYSRSTTDVRIILLTKYSKMSNITSSLWNHITKNTSYYSADLVVVTNTSIIIDNDSMLDSIINMENAVNSLESEWNKTISEINIIVNSKNNRLNEEIIKTIENNLVEVEEKLVQVQNEFNLSQQTHQVIEKTVLDITNDINQLNISYSDTEKELVYDSNYINVLEDEDKETKDTYISIELQQALDDLTIEIDNVKNKLESNYFDTDILKISDEINMIQQEMYENDIIQHELDMLTNEISVTVSNDKTVVFESNDSNNMDSLFQNELEIIKQSVKLPHDNLHQDTIKESFSIKEINPILQHTSSNNDNNNKGDTSIEENNSIDINNLSEEFDYAVSPRGGKTISPRLKCPANSGSGAITALTSFQVKNLKNLMVTNDVHPLPLVVDENIIIRHTKPKPLQFYAMDPNDAKLTILLYSKVNITYINFVHVAYLNESNIFLMNCAPNLIKLSGWTDDPTKIRDTRGKLFDLGEFSYSPNSEELKLSSFQESIPTSINNLSINRTVSVYEQKYNIKKLSTTTTINDAKKISIVPLPPLRAVTFDIKSNHGDPSITCVHRIQIFGVIHK